MSDGGGPATPGTGDRTLRGVDAPGPAVPGPAVPGRRRLVAAAAGVLFWGYLVVRWVNDWVLPAGVGVPAGQPFVSPQPFARLGAALRAVSGPVGGVADWLAGFAAFLELAVVALPDLAAGAWLSVVLVVCSLLGGLAIAVPLAVARSYGSRGLSWSALGYTELIRGTPLLAQLFVLYFASGLASVFRGFGFVGQGFVPGQAVWVAVVGFTINSSAYQAEYIRSALQSVDPGQSTAARAVGLSKLDAVRYVVLPQGLRFAIPAWSNEFVYLIKYSSLAAFITVPELFFRTQNLANETLRYVDLLTLAALFYLGMVLSASALMGHVERSVAIPGLGGRGPER